MMKKRLCLSVTCLLLIALGLSLLMWPAADKPDSEEGRVAVLFSSLAEMWIEAGGRVDITVGESIQRGIVEEALLVDETAGKSIHTELLISYQPRLVIYSLDIPAQVEAATLLEKAGIQVLGCKVDSFTDYRATMEQMCALTGNKAALSQVSARQKQIQTILATHEDRHPKILFIRAGSSASSTKAKLAKDHFACAMLEEMGCINIADEAPLLQDGLSMEAILRQQPEYIFFSLMGKEAAARANVEDLLQSEAWQALEAVKEERVYILPKDLFHYKPCGRWVESYEYLSNLLNGEN